ncbi:MAG: hypothetical protein V4440_12525 [Pseudomonadota bacterium]
MIEQFVLITLVALLVGSNIFWSTVCLKLTNRIMSKDYGALVEATKKPKPVAPIVFNDSDPIAEEYAKSANVLMGLV